MAIFNVPAQTFPNGDTLIPARSVPAGISQATLNIDVGQINPALGQVMWVTISLWDGTNWWDFNSDITAPSWTDKQGVTHTSGPISIGFGPGKVSDNNWQVKVLITTINGPIATSGGTLTVS